MCDPYNYRSLAQRDADRKAELAGQVDVLALVEELLRPYNAPEYEAPVPPAHLKPYNNPAKEDA